MSVAFDSTARTYTADGRLHISRSHISKACICPYYGREIPKWQQLGLEPNRIYRMLRPPEELAKAVDTFKMLPILHVHDFVPLYDRMDEEEKKKFIVGTTGSEVDFLDPFLDSDVTLWETHAIAGVETNKVREFSCSYRYVAVMASGEYKGEKYDGMMTEIQGTHLALIEAGRNGNEVAAADHKLETLTMKRTKLGNALIVATTTAFPTVAMDSKLETILASATRKSFGKTQRKEACDLIVAADSAIDSKQVIAVMDALVDVEPEEKKKHLKDCDCADCMSAEDEDEDDKDDKKKKVAEDEDEDEEEREKAKKKEAAKDKRAKDEDVKGAMDAAINSLRAEFIAIDQAKRDVRPVVGDIVAMDSAESIYGFALDHMKVKHKDIQGVAGKRALFIAVQDRQTITPEAPVAMDANIFANELKNFPNLAKNLGRIRIM